MALMLALAGSGTVAAQAPGIEGVYGALVTYGPLGIVSAWLIVRDWRLEERRAAERQAVEFAHREERAAAWRAVTELKREVQDGLGQANEHLARILTVIQERR